MERTEQANNDRQWPSGQPGDSDWHQSEEKSRTGRRDKASWKGKRLPAPACFRLHVESESIWNHNFVRFQPIHYFSYSHLCKIITISLVVKLVSSSPQSSLVSPHLKLYLQHLLLLFFKLPFQIVQALSVLFRFLNIANFTYWETLELSQSSPMHSHNIFMLFSIFSVLTYNYLFPYFTLEREIVDLVFSFLLFLYFDLLDLLDLFWLFADFLSLSSKFDKSLFSLSAQDA